MASTLQLLLRLPSALRRQAFTHAFPTRHLDGTNLRVFEHPFSHTRRITRQARPAQPPPKAPPFRKGRIQLPFKPKPKPATPPLQSTRPPAQQSGRKRFPALAALAQESDQVLLYRAPSHTSFFVSSYLLGIIFIFASVLQAYPLRADKGPGPNSRRIPWYVRSISASIAIFFGVIGTIIILAPNGLIKTITLVRRPETAQMLLRFQTKTPVPFVRRVGILDAPLDRVFLDSQVVGRDVTFWNVELANAKSWTEHNLNAHEQPRQSVLEGLRSFNHGLLNIWHAIRRDTRRMCLREGMVNVEIADSGKWKLDLNGCTILDAGRPLEDLVDQDPDRGYIRKIRGWFRNVFA